MLNNREEDFESQPLIAFIPETSPQEMSEVPRGRTYRRIRIPQYPDDDVFTKTNDAINDLVNAYEQLNEPQPEAMMPIVTMPEVPRQQYVYQPLKQSDNSIEEKLGMIYMLARNQPVPEQPRDQTIVHPPIQQSKPQGFENLTAIHEEELPHKEGSQLSETFGVLKPKIMQKKKDPNHDTTSKPLYPESHPPAPFGNTPDLISADSLSRLKYTNSKQIANPEPSNHSNDNQPFKIEVPQEPSPRTERFGGHHIYGSLLSQEEPTINVSNPEPNVLTKQEIPIHQPPPEKNIVIPNPPFSQPTGVSQHIQAIMDRSNNNPSFHLTQGSNTGAIGAMEPFPVRNLPKNQPIFEDRTRYLAFDSEESDPQSQDIRRSSGPALQNDVVNEEPFPIGNPQNMYRNPHDQVMNQALRNPGVPLPMESANGVFDPLKAPVPVLPKLPEPENHPSMASYLLAHQNMPRVLTPSDSGPAPGQMGGLGVVGMLPPGFLEAAPQSPYQMPFPEPNPFEFPGITQPYMPNPIPMMIPPPHIMPAPLIGVNRAMIPPLLEMNSDPRNYRHETEGQMMNHMNPAIPTVDPNLGTSNANQPATAIKKTQIKIVSKEAPSNANKETFLRGDSVPTPDGRLSESQRVVGNKLQEMFAKENEENQTKLKIVHPKSGKGKDPRNANHNNFEYLADGKQ